MLEKIGSKIDKRINLLIQIEKDTNVSEAIDLMESVLKRGNKILIFGNGGSASQSSHIASELVNRFYFNRPGLPAIALTTDTANITSIANDFDYKYIFSKQIEALGKPNDAAVGITTSGKSPNVLEAIKIAKKRNLKTICLCGKNTKPMEDLEVDIIVSVNSSDTPIIQEIHLFILHTFAEILERRIFKDK